MKQTIQVDVKGAIYDNRIRRMVEQRFNCFCTNNKVGKTLCVDNGEIQFIIPMQDLIKYFVENNQC